MMAVNKFMVAIKQVAIQFDIRNMDLGGEANSLGRSCGGVGGWGGGRKGSRNGWSFQQTISLAVDHSSLT